MSCAWRPALLGGTAVGVGLTFLLAATMWARGDRTRSVVAKPAALIVPLAVATSIGALAVVGLPLLYAPFAVGLLLAAVGVFATLTSIALALVSNRGWTYGSFSEMGPLACAGLVAAIVLMTILSGLRSVLELWFALPKLT